MSINRRISDRLFGPSTKDEAAKKLLDIEMDIRSLKYSLKEEWYEEIDGKTKWFVSWHKWERTRSQNRMLKTENERLKSILYQYLGDSYNK